MGYQGATETVAGLPSAPACGRKACPDNMHQDFGSPAQECWFSRQKCLCEEGGKGALKSPAGEGQMSGTGGGGVGLCQPARHPVATSYF